MTTPTPSLSPVELIAEALDEHQYDDMYGRCGCRNYTYSDWLDHIAEVILAAIRSWPAPTQAQLIGGEVESE